MHIVINAMFWGEPNTGSGQYLHGLVQALREIAPEHRYTLLLPVGKQPAPDLPHVELIAPVRHANLAKLWFEQIGVPRMADTLGADVLFVPYAAAPLFSPVPVVTTVHDIIWHLLPEYRGKRAFRAYARLVIAATRRAAHVIADSEHSRRDIIVHLGIAPERVTTVLLAAGAQYHERDRGAVRAEVAARYGLAQPFVYYVGGLDARKNVATLLRAWAMLWRAGGPMATLAIAGRAFSEDTLLFPDIDGLIAELGIGASVRRLDVPREDNPLLYSAATVFAYPSRYEGFGLGPLEAMACGTPVICSNASSLPEVVGDAALTAAPDDVAGWAAALWRVLADEELRDDLRERGRRRAAMFSYGQAARQVLAVFEQAMRVTRRQRVRAHRGAKA